MLGLSNMMRSDVSVRHAILTWWQAGHPMVRYKCWAVLFYMVTGWASHGQMSMLKKKKTYMEAMPTTSMKRGWLCRTSCDEKNHEIAPVMLTQ